MTDLDKILKGVSRSFYLSLALLPRRVRRPMGIAFLCCKAADTIADTDLIPEPERLKLLEAYRELFANPLEERVDDVFEPVLQAGGGMPAEALLIRSLPQLLSLLSLLPPADQRLIQELVLELTQGMEIDLTFFAGAPREKSKGFENLSQLEEYIYYVAGCVGRFWTKVMQAHFSFAGNFGEAMFTTGEKLGKGLQLVNILRDMPHDLRRGRRYLPEGVPLTDIFALARGYLGEYEGYCRHFPWYALRLKAAVRLPARLGFQTLELLESAGDWPRSERVVKVSRGQVYKTLIGSFFR